MTGLGWLFVLTTVLLAGYGLARLPGEMRGMIATGAMPAWVRVPAMAVAALLAVVAIGVALAVASMLRAGTC